MEGIEPAGGLSNTLGLDYLACAYPC